MIGDEFFAWLHVNYSTEMYIWPTKYLLYIFRNHRNNLYYGEKIFKELKTRYPLLKSLYD